MYFDDTWLTWALLVGILMFFLSAGFLIALIYFTFDENKRLRRLRDNMLLEKELEHKKYDRGVFDR